MAAAVSLDAIEIVPPEEWPLFQCDVCSGGLTTFLKSEADVAAHQSSGKHCQLTEASPIHSSQEQSRGPAHTGGDGKTATGIKDKRG